MSEVFHTVKLSLETGQRRKLGEILIEEKMITEDLLDLVLAQQKTAKNTRLGTLLMNLGILTPQQFMRALSKQLTVVHRSLARV